MDVQNSCYPHPLRPITSHFCLIPPLPQSGRHMCIAPYVSWRYLFQFNWNALFLETIRGGIFDVLCFLSELFTMQRIYLPQVIHFFGWKLLMSISNFGKENQLLRLWLTLLLKSLYWLFSFLRVFAVIVYFSDQQ